jgi:glutamyl/glutaminyl-tRNA synthetase
LKHEVLSVAEMEQMFNIQKVGKSGVKFEEKKLEFLNSMHIRN